TRDHDLTVKAARTQQCRVKHVGTVGRGDDDDTFIGFKAVHFDKKLVQRLFALVIAVAKTGTAVTADSVNLVNEDDAGRVLFRLFKHVADTAGADADKHFNKVGTGNREKRHFGFASNGAGKKGFTRTRRTDQQSAFGDLTAKLCKAAGIFQKFDDFFQFFARFVNTGHVLERDFSLLFGQQFCFGFAKAHRARTAAFLHLAQHKKRNTQNEQERQRLDQQILPDARAFFSLAAIFHTFFIEQVDKARVAADRGGRKLVAVSHLAGDFIRGNRNAFDAAFRNLGPERGIADRIGAISPCVRTK